MLHPHAHSLASWPTLSENASTASLYAHIIWFTTNSMTIVKWEIPTCWHLSGVHGTEKDATHILFSEQAQMVFLRQFANSQNVPCYCTCHYMILRLASGASWGQMQLLEPFCLLRPQFTPVCCTHSDTIFWTSVQLWENVCLLLGWQCKNILWVVQRVFFMTE